MGLLSLDVLSFQTGDKNIETQSKRHAKRRATIENVQEAFKGKRGHSNVLRKPLHLHPGWKEMSQAP